MKLNHWMVMALTAAVAVLATLLITGRYDIVRPAQAQESAAGSYMVALIGEQVTQQYPLFLVDTKEMSILVYEYDRGNGSLELHAARTFQYDRKLTDYEVRSTTQRRVGPSVDQVRQAIMAHPGGTMPGPGAGAGGGGGIK
jgi:hypothetical protein